MKLLSFILWFCIFLWNILYSANVVIMIGDGMGLSQRTAARIASRGVDGFLYIDRLPYVGFLKTYSKNSLITDSAAGATALATGEKTNNGMLSMAPDNTDLRTIIEIAEDAGMSTGLVTTTRITHATPAAFAVHISSRKLEDKIAEEIILSGVDVLLGGGLGFFLPSSHKNSWRKDDNNLIREAEEKGYYFVNSRKELVELNLNRVEKLLGLFSYGHIDYIDERGDEIPSLPLMVKTALSVLARNEKGFFLMIEGGRIDHAGHRNDYKRVLLETIEFDKAVGVVFDFLDKYPNTLLIVLADHETGGMAINGPYLEFPDYKDENRDGSPDMETDTPVEIGWTSKGHTGVDIPISAKGVNAEKIKGVMDNTDIFYIMQETLLID